MKRILPIATIVVLAASLLVQVYQVGYAKGHLDATQQFQELLEQEIARLEPARRI